MTHRDWYAQSIVFLILLFLIGSALAVAYDDITRTRSLRHGGAPHVRHSVTLSVSFDTAEMRDAGAWCPVIEVRNLGSGEAIVEVVAYDAEGSKPPVTLAEGGTISIPVGGSATVVLAGAEGLPSGEYSFALTANQPITGSVVHQTADGKGQENEL